MRRPDMERMDQHVAQIEARRPQTPIWDTLADQLRWSLKRAHDEAREGRASTGYWRFKLQRTLYFLRHEFGHRQQRCGACNGSGCYDNNGSPPCGACDGSGKETFPGPKSLTPPSTTGI